MGQELGASKVRKARVIGDDSSASILFPLPAPIMAAEAYPGVREQMFHNL